MATGVMSRDTDKSKQTTTNFLIDIALALGNAGISAQVEQEGIDALGGSYAVPLQTECLG
jgi:hypothetical protein